MLRRTLLIAIVLLLSLILDVQVFFNNNDKDWVSAGINRLDLGHFSARLVLTYPCLYPIPVVIVGVKKNKLSAFFAFQANLISLF